MENVKMKKQELISAVQSVMSLNRDIINMQHQDIHTVKELKKAFDAAGDQAEEYYYHNLLQRIRSRHRKNVANQESLKFILQELYAAEDF